MTKYVPLNFKEHSSLRVITDFGVEFGNDRMFAPIFPHEFRQVQADVPIVFTKETQSSRYRPVALFGLEQGENLYLKDDRWDTQYVPISVRMNPFIIGRKGNNDLSVHIDIESSRVNYKFGEKLFDDEGEQTGFLSYIVNLLYEIHESEQKLPTFCALLEELSLIEPLTFKAELDDGTEGKLTGFSTIVEERLEELDESSLYRLSTSGALMPVFMILASTSNFVDLVKRKKDLKTTDLLR